MDQFLRILSAIEAATTCDQLLGKHTLEHFLEVAGLVARATEEPDLDLVVVAILHHAIADGEVTFDVIERHWGTGAKKLAMEFAIGKVPAETGKQRRGTKLSTKVKILHLADWTSILRALADRPPSDWSAKKCLQHACRAEHVLKECNGCNEWLESQFSAAAAEVKSRATAEVARVDTGGRGPWAPRADWAIFPGLLE
jgi:hypothetical protein